MGQNYIIPLKKCVNLNLDTVEGISEKKLMNS